VYHPHHHSEDVVLFIFFSLSFSLPSKELHQCCYHFNTKLPQQKVHECSMSIIMDCNNDAYLREKAYGSGEANVFWCNCGNDLV
jgi:hypothetical protein